MVGLGLQWVLDYWDDFVKKKFPVLDYRDRGIARINLKSPDNQITWNFL